MKAVQADLIQLAREMNACWHLLDELPDDQAWTQEQLAALDDVRHAALRLANVAEVIIQELQGHRPSNG
jgi:HD-like signal output (HDOD) protein